MIITVSILLKRRKTKLNKKTFSGMIEILEASYKEKINKETSKIYWDMLKNYDDKIIKETTIRCIKELKYFPKISEIIEMIEGNSTDEAELAWLYLLDKIEYIGHYQSVSFPDYPAIGAVVEAMGGWLEICDMKIDEEKWVKKEFIKLYPIMKKRGDYPDKLIGQFELDNGNRYTEKFMLEEFGRRLDGKKVDRKLIEDKSNPQFSGESGEGG